MIVIPAKHASSRLPAKNFKPFFEGLSLLQIAVIRSVMTQQQVFINSEEPDMVRNQINDLPNSIRQNVKIVERDKKLAKDPATIVDVLRDTIEKCGSDEFEFLTCVLPTSPFNSSASILKAIETFRANSYERLISISASNKPPFNAWFLSKNMELNYTFRESPFRSTKSTECPVTYLSNGCIGIYRVDKLHAGIAFDRIHGFEMDKISSIDIDHEFEFNMASAIFSQFSNDIALIKRSIVC